MRASDDKLHPEPGFVTATVWMGGQVLSIPAILGLTMRFRTGGLGGTGATLSIAGSLGIAAYLVFLFPELVGFRPDSIDRAETALALQAAGELGAASFLTGWGLFALSLLSVRGMPFMWLSAVLVLAGTLVAPLGLVEFVWLPVGACLLGAGIASLGLLLTRTRASRVPEPVLGLGRRESQLKF
jgi:hypothetical protein